MKLKNVVLVPESGSTSGESRTGGVLKICNPGISTVSSQSPRVSFAAKWKEYKPIENPDVL